MSLIEAPARRRGRLLDRRSHAPDLTSQEEQRELDPIAHQARDQKNQNPNQDQDPRAAAARAVARTEQSARPSREQEAHKMQPKPNLLGSATGPPLAHLRRRRLLLLLLLLALNFSSSLELGSGQVAASPARPKGSDDQGATSVGQLIAGGHAATAPFRQLLTSDEEPAESRLSGDFRPTPTSGRLVDRIAEPLATAGAGNQQQQDKLDYIIHFLRQHQLGKFCDLLTSSAAVELVRQLNGLRQFTLFVPTNEALLLMPVDQLESIESSAAETRQFLMAHATSELVVPKLWDSRAGSGGGESRAQLAATYSPSGSLNRWSSGRALDRIAPQPLVQRQQQPSSNALLHSLAGGPLRVVTAPSSLAANSTKLELIVNGANVLGGHSHALQEPNNTSVTYAIVHLIDRPLYPVAKFTLLERLQLVAPKFCRLLRLADDQDHPWLLRQLSSPARQLTTVFAPNDDAFRHAPGQLIGQLETNRTFLQQFLGAHLMDGLYYSGQLAPPLASLSATAAANATAGPPAPHVPRQLTSMAGQELEFEFRVLQARQLILVNSVPVLEPDLVALNGVIHVLVRPLFERRSLDVACNCESKLQPDNSTADWLRLRELQLGDQLARLSKAQRLTSTSLSSWFREASPRSRSQTAPEPTALGAPELERQESQARASSSVAAVQKMVVRAQRSDGNLIARNNRDFYRPAVAPANLALQQDGPQSETARRRQETPGSLGRGLVLNSGGLDQPPQMQANATTSGRLQQVEAHQLRPVQWPVEGQQLREAPLSSAFDVERYKVVMNATMRQKLREQHQQPQTQQAAGLIMSSSVSNEREALRHQRLQQAPPTNLFAYDQPLATPPSSSADSSLWSYSAPVSSGVQGNQTARLQHQPAPDQVSPSASMLRHQRLLKFQAEDARDSKQQQQDATSKTSVAPPNFSGCAFYDTECKRQQLGTKFVRLPARQPANKVVQQQQQLNSTGQQTGGFGPTTPPSAFDSTFGETTVGSLGLWQAGSRFSTPLSVIVPQQQHSQLAHLSPPKDYLSFGPSGGPAAPLSPLNQPLPPWGEDEHKLASATSRQQQASRPVAGQPGQSWRAQEVSDLARLKLADEGPRQRHEQSSPSNLTSSSSKVAALMLQQQPPQQVLLIPIKMLHDSNISLAGSRLMRSNVSSQTATARPIYFATPHAAGQLSVRPSGAAFSSSAQHFTPTLQPSSNVLAGARRPAAGLGRLTNFTALESVPLDGFEASSSSSTHRGSKQPTRPAHGLNLDRQQQQQFVQQQQQLREHFGATAAKGDISITSAKLTRPSNSSAGGLAVQASNQLPFGASADQLASSSADFFQNRTIGEIMDDSGLRIDGQQVTFGRLRECLDRAELANLLVQPASELTIFMPTDLAFQRLVQQQALQQQRNPRPSASSSSSGTLSARLTDPARRHLLPLVARASNNHRPAASVTDTTGELSRLQAQDPGALGLAPGGDLSSAALAQRLTLDCSTQQVRQLLLDHLSSRLVTPKQLQRDLVLDSLSGRRLLLSSVPSKKIVVVDGQPVIAATRAKNGMVYVVNKFLNISQQAPDVIELLEAQPNLKTFQSYLAFSSLADRLKRESGPLTILAPTNEAFEQLSSSARQLLNSDPAAMLDILRGHIIEGAQFGKLISMRSRLKTMNSDHYIEAKVIKPNVYQLDSQMTSMRLVGTSGNGVVNAIDRLIVPPWLKVAPAGGQASLATNRLQPDLVDQPRSVLELDDSLAAAGGGVPGALNAQRQTIGSLNLPSLNGQPLRFEQPPAARPAPTNSFALAGPDSSARGRPGDSAAGSFETSEGAPAGRQPAARPPNESPLLRPANSTTGGGSSWPASLTPPGGRLSSADGSDFDSDWSSNPNSNFLAANSTAANATSKNMLLIEKLAGLMKSRKFVKYLLKSRLSEQLKPDMNYVILVPTDQAVERLPRQIIEMLERDPERLADLVSFHVLDTTFEYINTIPDGQTLNTLNEKDILFNWHRNSTILTASGAVVLGGIQEENIALLVVDRVLYPTPGDLLSIVTKSPILSNFTSLVRNAGLEQQLSLAGPFTLFAPSDFAFNQLDKRDLDFLKANRESARRFLLRHLSQPAVFTSSIALGNSSAAGQLAPQMAITNSLGEDLALRQKHDYFSVNDVNFSYADVAATNGVVHVIDGLL